MCTLRYRHVCKDNLFKRTYKYSSLLISVGLLEKHEHINLVKYFSFCRISRPNIDGCQSNGSCQHIISAQLYMTFVNITNLCKYCKLKLTRDTVLSIKTRFGIDNLTPYYWPRYLLSLASTSTYRPILLLGLTLIGIKVSLRDNIH